MTASERMRDFLGSGVCHVSLVLTPVFLAAWIGPGVWLDRVSAYGLGYDESGLLNLMHECAHFHAFQKRQGSDLLGHWLLDHWRSPTLNGYRQRHWKHHTNLGVDGDTKDAYLVDIHGWQLPSVFLQCLSLQMAVRKFPRAG